jgi:uncharacterized lipoprotein YajG
MSTLRTMNTAAVLAFTLAGCAQMPGGMAAAPPAQAESMAAMDAHTICTTRCRARPRPRNAKR